MLGKRFVQIDDLILRILEELYMGNIKDYFQNAAKAIIKSQFY